MDATERELLEKYAPQDEELNSLWDEHKLLAKQLAPLEEKPYLTPEDEKKVKELKKLKLDAKTRLLARLDQYKQ